MVDLSIGAVVMVSAYVFFDLRTEGKLFVPIPFVPRIPLGGTLSIAEAFPVAVGVCVLYGILLSNLVFRRLRTVTPIARMVASLGVLIVFQQVVIVNFGTLGQGGQNVLPTGTIRLLGANVPWNRFVLAGLVILAAVSLTLVYRFTRFGIATRAAAENDESAVLAGLLPARIATLNTVIAYIVVGSLGILVAPTTTLDPTVITLSVIPALGAALLARFSSFIVTVGAGLLLGVIQSELVYLQLQKWFPQPGGNPMPGVADVVYFLVIVVALFWRGKTLPTRGAVTEQRLPPAPRPQRFGRNTLILSSIASAGLIFLPFDYRQALINTLVGIILCLSFVVITGYIGQVSLIQTALAGVAGFTLFHLAHSAGIGFPLAPIIAIGVALVFAFLDAVPALRIRGVHLAVVTLAGAVALERFGFDNGTWGQVGTITAIPPPKIFGLNLGDTAHFPGWDGEVPSPTFGFLCLLVVLVACTVVATLRKSMLGQRMLAVRSNERAAAGCGISVQRTKMTAFMIGSAISATAGCMYAYDYGSVTGQNFTIVIGLSFLTFAYLGGITSVGGAILAGTFVVQSLPGYAINQWTGLSVQYQILVGGIALIWTILFQPQGIALQNASGKGLHTYIIRGILWPVRRVLSASSDVTAVI